MKKSIAWICAGLCMMVLHGKDVTAHTENWNNLSAASSKFQKIEFEGTNVLEVRGKGQLRSKEMFPVAPGRIWKFSGEFRLAPGCKGALLFYGLIPFDGEKKQIYSGQFTIEKDTLTSVRDHAKKGDKTLILENASKWKTGGPFCVALNARENLSDLPNRELTPTIKKITKEGSHWIVELNEGLPGDVPAGVMVREHRHGSSFAYSMAGAIKITNEWKTFSAVIKDQITDGVMSFSKFWPKTQFVQLGILVFPTRRDVEPGILFRKIKVEEITR